MMAHNDDSALTSYCTNCTSSASNAFAANHCVGLLSVINMETDKRRSEIPVSRMPCPLSALSVILQIMADHQCYQQYKYKLHFMCVCWYALTRPPSELDSFHDML
jgi:hypothetical protein